MIYSIVNLLNMTNATCWPSSSINNTFRKMGEGMGEKIEISICFKNMYKVKKVLLKCKATEDHCNKIYCHNWTGINFQNQNKSNWLISSYRLHIVNHTFFIFLPLVKKCFQMIMLQQKPHRMIIISIPFPSVVSCYAILKADGAEPVNFPLNLNSLTTHRTQVLIIEPNT